MLVLLTRNLNKGTIRAEFPDIPHLTEPPCQTWVDHLRPFLGPAPSWSIYTDASWRALHPPQAQAVFGLLGSHQGRGALFLSADYPDWCSDILAVCFEIPPTLQACGGTAQVAELLAINAGLQLLHSLHLSGTVYSDCLSAVNKITRRWSSGRSFLEAGAALVSSSRTFLSDQIQLKWIKGHPEQSDTPPAAWSKHQWGIYLADALAKNRDIGSLPFSPVPTIQIHPVLLHDMQMSTPPHDAWQWLGAEGSPPLGSLHALTSHHRVLAYRTNRDNIRTTRGAPPIWEDSHQSFGAFSWFSRPQPLRQQVHALRTLWDLRWHGENKAVAAHSLDPQVSACPICHRFWSQCYATARAPLRRGWVAHWTSTSLSVDPPPGPMLELGRQFQLLLSTFNQPSIMARRWAGQCDQAAIRSLQPAIARCNSKQIKAVLGHLGRVTSTTASACWRDFTAMAKDLTPPVDFHHPPTPTAARQLSTIDWDPRLGEDHG